MGRTTVHNITKVLVIVHIKLGGAVAEWS